MMKKFISVLVVFMLVFLCSCKNNASEETSYGGSESNSLSEEKITYEVTTAESLSVEELIPSKVITVYFSHNDPVGGVAEYLSEKTEGALFRIETLGEYPDNEKELIKRAAEEHSANVRPALKNAPLSLSEYDIVFLCFPEWDNTMPMALFTFIEDYDMRDKAVIPVIYGDESALDNAVRDIHSLVPSMMIVSGYRFVSDFTEEQKEFDKWIDTVLYG